MDARPAALGPQLVLRRWPAGTYGDGAVHLRVAVKNGGPGRMPSNQSMGLLIRGTLHIQTPGGAHHKVLLGLWRGPAPPDVGPGGLASHCMNGAIEGLLKRRGLSPHGRHRFWWTSRRKRSNVLVVDLPKAPGSPKACRCRP